MTAELRDNARRMTAGFALQVAGAVLLVTAVSPERLLLTMAVLLVWVIGVFMGVGPMLLGKVGPRTFAWVALIATVGTFAASLYFGLTDAAAMPGSVTLAAAATVVLPLIATAVSIVDVSRELRRHPVGPL